MEKNKLDNIDKFMLMYFIVQIFFIRWFNSKCYISYVGIILMALIIFKKKNIFRVKISDVIICYVFVSIVIINLIGNGVKPLLVNNLYTFGIANLLVIIYILILGSEEERALRNFIVNDMFYIFNGYFILNIPILIMQLQGTGFLMRNISENKFYEDHITGLIGANGTHELTFYWIILILINMYRAYVKKEKFLYLISILYMGFMIFVSSQNDNTAFFLIFPLILFQYFIKYFFNNKRLIMNAVKILSILLICITALGILYKENIKVRQFVDTRVVEKLCQYGLVQNDSKKTEYGWNNDEERIGLCRYALENGNGYGIGKGIGSIKQYGDNTMPPHFGMSEISLRIYEGGIIYLLGYIFMFSHFLYGIFRINNNNHKIMGFIFIFIDISLFSVYTLIFRFPFFTFAVSIITFLFNCNYKKKNMYHNREKSDRRGVLVEA